jgi:hypothetical protein
LKNDDDRPDVACNTTGFDEIFKKKMPKHPVVDHVGGCGGGGEKG